MPALLDQLAPHIRPGARVLDLGAGEGKQAARLRDLGANVVAIDREIPAPTPEGIEWHQSDILDWLRAHAAERFDVVLMRNVLQYFTPDVICAEILPQVVAMLQPGGIIAIETFSKEPIPPFARPFTTHHTCADLLAYFPDWHTLHQWEGPHLGPDLKGTERMFSLSQISVQKRV